MKTSDKINELAESLAAAQPKIGIAIKNAVNPHLKNRYADLGAVWDACSDALKSSLVVGCVVLSFSATIPMSFEECGGPLGRCRSCHRQRERARVEREPPGACNH